MKKKVVSLLLVTTMVASLEPDVETHLHQEMAQKRQVRR